MRTLNVQLIVDTGDDKNDEQIVGMLRNQFKMQKNMFPSQIKMLFGEENEFKV